MRINKFVAQASGLSRRTADAAIAQNRVTINGAAAEPGQEVHAGDTMTLDGKSLTLPASHTTLLFHKPIGYVTSRDGQGSRTVYDLLPPEFHRLKPVGRLDKDSSGLLLLTDDGELANRLTHPRYVKEKIYLVTLDRALTAPDQERLAAGISLEDGLSHLKVKPQAEPTYEVRMTEGRNRQIRRTFTALKYHVQTLHRIVFGGYVLGDLQPGDYRMIKNKE